MEQALTLKDSDGHTVAAILTSPPETTDKVAVLCHGFLSGKNSTTNKALTRLLVERNIATLRFDFFGHGDSQGPFEDLRVTFAMKQALAALEFVSSKGYSRVGLVGSSFGGLVSILAAARAASSSLGPHRGSISQDTLTCLALKCPVVDFPEELNLELGREGMMEWKRTNTIPDILGGPDRIKLAYAFYEDCLRNVGYDAVAKILAPTIIVQGEADELIPLHQSRRFFDSLKASRSLCLLPGADHQFSKAEDFNQMVRLIGDWVSLYLSREGA